MSAELTRVAHNAAEELKHERLERARKGKSAGPQSAEVQSALVEDSGRTRTHRKTSGGIKRDASSRSLGARRQAKRDRR